MSRRDSATHTVSAVSNPDAAATGARMGPMIDANLHLWDQAANPVFWLSDRSLVVDMLGDYDSLPDRYTLDDHLEAIAPHTVDGVIWSDAGAADPLAALRWVRDQDRGRGLVSGLVTLADPFAAGFASFVTAAAAEPLVSAVRIRLVASLRTAGGADEGTALVDGLRRVADAGLVVIVETDADQIPRVVELAAQLPDLRIVLDHFGWPSDLSAGGLRTHLDALQPVAACSNVATRLDALGTIFGSWDVDTIRPWLQGTVELFGCDRCMFGSDFPIETLRSTYAGLCAAYEEAFAGRTDDERRHLFHDTALTWLAAHP